MSHSNQEEISLDDTPEPSFPVNTAQTNPTNPPTSILPDANIPADDDAELLLASESQFSNTAPTGPLPARTTQFLKSLRIKFRNYKPKTEALQDFYTPAAPSMHILSSITQDIIAQEYKHLNVNILPVKQDWDLKRDIEGDLGMLDVETMRVMKQMVEERMA